MPDVDSLYKVQNILGNIRGMIRKPLQRSGDRHEIETRPDIVRISFRKRNQLLIASGPEDVNGIVRARTLRASPTSCATNASRLFFTMDCTRPAISGISTIASIPGASIND